MLLLLTIHFELIGQLKRKHKVSMKNAVFANMHAMDDFAYSSTPETLNANTLKGSPPKTGIKSIFKTLGA